MVPTQTAVEASHIRLKPPLPSSRRSDPPWEVLPPQRLRESHFQQRWSCRHLAVASRGRQKASRRRHHCQVQLSQGHHVDQPGSVHRHVMRRSCARYRQSRLNTTVPPATPTAGATERRQSSALWREGAARLAPSAATRARQARHGGAQGELYARRTRKKEASDRSGPTQIEF